MSGPMQWTPQGMVPAGSPRPVSEDPTPAVVLQMAHTVDEDEDDDVAPTPRALPAKKMLARAKVELAPKDVIKLARARLRDVDREIKLLKKLEVERDQLRRLLDAATNRPRALVHELPKRSAG